MKHFIIPDTQVKPGINTDHLEAAGNYIAAKKPDVIIHLGDHWDMQSLSSYDKGTIKAEGVRYQNDIDAGVEAMERMMYPISKVKGYKPKKFFLFGNHEQRIQRHVEANPSLAGKLSYDDFKLSTWKFTVVDYLKPLRLDGIYYCHYFYNPNTGKPYTGTASTRLSNLGFSFTMGHQQGKDIAEKHLANGKTIRGLIAGSFYQHNEDYKGPQGNHHWRGCIMKHEVKDGNYGLMEISLQYLLKEWL